MEQPRSLRLGAPAECHLITLMADKLDKVNHLAVSLMELIKKNFYRRINVMLSQVGKYNMKAASQILGIQPGTLRAWERRYHMIAPVRNELGYRSLYRGAN